MTNQDLLSRLQELKAEFPELNNTMLEIKDDTINIIPETSEKCLYDFNPQVAVKETLMGPSPKLEIRQSPLHGYGIFAKESIQPGELLEEARIIKLEVPSKYTYDTVLKDYCFSSKSCKCSACKKHGTPNFFALGFAALFNHSDTPHVQWKVHYDAGYMTIKAIRPIEAGEEVFTTYGKKYFLLRKFWNKINRNGPKTLILENEQ